jgi:hypothetical protein
VSRTCQYEFSGASGAAAWSFDGTALVVSPADGRPLVFPVQEMAGLAGDGYSISISVPGPAAPPPTGGAVAATPGVAGHPQLALAKLGAEGPTLLDTLQRAWLVARAAALRLSGTGEGKPFSGMVAGLESGTAARGAARDAASPAPESFRALLFEDVMVIAREGRDLDPVFMALTEKIAFDEATYSIRVSEWPDREIVLSKLGKQAQDLLDRLRTHRSALAHESAGTLASTVPALASTYRGILAGEWPSGRLRTLQDLTSICPGFEQAFRTTWLAGCPRKDEGTFLLDWAGPADSWLGCSREAGESGETLLWLLAQKNGTWFLEALTGEDRATYHFVGGAEMPALASRLLCAPQFSREALYGGPEMLTGERADLAIAAQSLAFLAHLRTRFTGRVIHSSPEGWRADMEKAACH